MSIAVEFRQTQLVPKTTNLHPILGHVGQRVKDHDDVSNGFGTRGGPGFTDFSNELLSRRGRGRFSS